MATINIGSLTFTHKGDYASGTTYAKNDVVYYSTNGNAYIAKQATTGNAPTSTAHWDVFAAGSGGIWNAGLSLGSAGQIVKVNSSGNALEFGADQGGKILQMATANKSDHFSTNSQSYVDITGLSASLTPSATTSKFLIQVSMGSVQSSSSSGRSYVRIKQAITGGSTTYPFLGDAGTGHEAIVTTCLRSSDGDWQQFPTAFMKLTSALNTTSAVTFTVQLETDGNVSNVNKSHGTDGNTGNSQSSLTIFEIAG